MVCVCVCVRARFRVAGQLMLNGRRGLCVHAGDVQYVTKNKPYSYPRPALVTLFEISSHPVGQLSCV